MRDKALGTISPYADTRSVKRIRLIYCDALPKNGPVLIITDGFIDHLTPKRELA